MKNGGNLMRMREGEYLISLPLFSKNLIKIYCATVSYAWGGVRNLHLLQGASNNSNFCSSSMRMIFENRNV